MSIWYNTDVTAKTGPQLIILSAQGNPYVNPSNIMVVNSTSKTIQCQTGSLLGAVGQHIEKVLQDLVDLNYKIICGSSTVEGHHLSGFLIPYREWNTPKSSYNEDSYDETTQKRNLDD